ncbi:MAG: hypothetical protein Q7T18_05545, partial [Sedimentisphaerales bacterium]|nr:hypothetical protein [Sedimentisphaerales bacterium]
NFVAAGIQELLKTNDFSTIGNVRLEIVARAHSSQPSADIQYNPQFIAAVAKSLEKAFADAAKISDIDRQAKITLNLIILLDNLDNVQLANLALKMIDSEDAAVRYWAVHAITNQKIIEQFNTGKAPAAVARTITERLAARINVETSPYIISQIVQFSAAVNIPQAQSLLMQTADMRLKKYQTWTVDNIPIDELTLRLLGEKATGPDKAAAARRFAQLFSYAMEFYIKGRVGLDKAQKEQLASVLVQTESRVLPKLLGAPQAGIKKAVEKDTDQALMAEHKDLFGDGETRGKLGTALNIEYQNADGTKRVTPLPLPEKPKTK